MNKEQRNAFRLGQLSEQERIITLLIEKGIIRRDAFGVLVRETMDDHVTDLPELEEADPDELPGDRISVFKSELGAMLSRAMSLHRSITKQRLIVLRELTEPNSQASLAITKWVAEYDQR